MGFAEPEEVHEARHRRCGLFVAPEGGGGERGAVKSKVGNAMGFQAGEVVMKVLAPCRLEEVCRESPCANKVVPEAQDLAGCLVAGFGR